MKSDSSGSRGQKKPEASADEAASVETLSPLREAIDLTLRTIEGRARLYRNLLVAVSGASVSSLATALFLRSARPLAGLILVVPLAGVFLFLDSRRVRLWRTAVLERCRQHGLPIADFLQTISQFKHVPPGALHTMLATLPAEQTGKPRRLEGMRSVGNPPDPFSRCAEWRILAATVMLALALAGVVAAMFWSSVWPLLPAAGFGGIAALLRMKWIGNKSRG